MGPAGPSKKPKVRPRGILAPGPRPRLRGLLARAPVHLLSLKVMRRTALLLALAAALCPAARGQTPAADPGAPADLSASGPISTDYVTGELVAKPDARLAGTDFL
jgi:hypothetical protein